MAADQPTFEPPRKSVIPIWRDERFLRFATQVISAALVIAILWWGIDNFLSAMQQRGMSMSFRFLRDSAGFPISDSPIPYDPSRSFGYAFYVGVVNTIRIASIGIVLTTILGVIVGIARLSTNWLVNRIALAFIEFHRNIPLLVLLFIWYFAVFLKLPGVEDSIHWPGSVYLNQRGLFIPWLQFTETSSIFLIFLGIGVMLAVIAWVWLSKVRVSTGKPTYYGAISFALFIFTSLIGWLLTGGNPIDIDSPILVGFNFRGGTHLSPEFTALLVGLVTYTAAFVAEVVRAGIQAVSRGQIEAARAVGLKYGQVLSLIILPQAMRVIIPPLISQYLNLTKNSSLAFFIGYIDLFYVGRTTMNQAGRAVQVFLLVMAAYLIMSL